MSTLAAQWKLKLKGEKNRFRETQKKTCNLGEKKAP